jgi:hypothetical protein
MTLTPDLARTIIKQAREDETYEGPIPDDDAKALEAAEGLITMAEEAWAANVKGPEVESILRLAASAENGASADDDDSAERSHDADGESPAGADGGELEQPLAAYDDLKASEVIANIEDVVAANMDSDDKLTTLGEISEYESANKGRKTILDAVAEAVEEVERVAAEIAQADTEPEPEPEPEPAAAEGDDDYDAKLAEYAQTEPWENYDKDKVADIVDGLKVSQEEDSEEDFNDLALNVWAYESAHKNRSRILSALEKMAGVEPQEGSGEEGKDEGEEPPAAEAGAGEASDAAASGDDAGGAEAVPQGEADGESDRTSDREADAGAEARQSAPAGDPQVEEAEVEIAAQVEAELRRELLHIPPPIEADPVDMPFDLTTLSDKQLHFLHGAFSAYAYRMNYLYMLEDAKARVWKEKADELTHALMKDHDRIDSQTSKPKTVALIEAEIASDPNVKKARRAQHKHESFAESYRKQRDSYTKNVDVLSRQEAMRQGEWERAGGKSGGRRS